MKKLLVGLFLILQVIEVKAILLEPYVFSSYGKAAHPNESESPTMVAHGLGTSLLFEAIPMIYIGASADYRFYNQLSTVKSPYGNRTGKRLAISPTLAVKIGPVLFKYYYHLLGDYKLDNATSSGSKVTYKGVTGHTFWLSMPIAPMLRIGAFYELEKFGKSQTGSVETDLKAANNQLKFNKYGLYLSILI